MARRACWGGRLETAADAKEIGYLPENLRIPRHHTAYTALDLYGQFSGLSSAEIRKRRGPLLELVDLADRAKDSVRKYSKGMLQRLGLAIALLHDPQLIFMDEPTDGLDPAGRAKVRQVLQRLKQEGKTIFLNSHLLQEVEMVCDRVAILDRGVLRGIGTVDQLVVSQPEGVKIEMQVMGREEAMRGALRDVAELPDAAIGPETYALTLQLADQQAVDRCVDALRSRQVSIIVIATSSHEPGRSFPGSARNRNGPSMRPYLAIIKDSFREALASRVLWILLILITFGLAALAPLGFRSEKTTEFRQGDFLNARAVAREMIRQYNSGTPSPGLSDCRQVERGRSP